MKKSHEFDALKALSVVAVFIFFGFMVVRAFNSGGGYTALVSDPGDPCNPDTTKAPAFLLTAGGNYESDVWATTDLANWQLLTNTPGWPGRIDHGSVFFDGKYWIFGGEAEDSGGNEYDLNDVWSSPDGATWTQVLASAPWSPRHNFATTVYKNKIWIVGGEEQPGSLTDVWSSCDGMTWKLVSDAPGWPGQKRNILLPYKNKLWLLGGYSSEDVWNSSDGVTWTLKTSTAPWADNTYGNLQFLAGTVYHDRMWVIDGNPVPVGYTSAGVWHSSGNGLNWVNQTMTPPWGNTYGDSAALVRSNMLYLVDGMTATSDLAVYSTVDGSTWTSVPQQTLPAWGERDGYRIAPSQL